MARLLLGCLLLCALASPGMAALSEGDGAPDFQAQASLAGKAFNFSLKEALKKGPVVVYFFPAAYTGTCNIQAHEFAANYEKFVAAGATVVGVSLDSITRLNAFSADPDSCAGKVAVASDSDGRISKSYGLRVEQPPPGVTDTQGYAIEHGLVEQVTFVVTADGKIAATIRGDSPSSNVAKALEAVQRVAAKQVTRAPGDSRRYRKTGLTMVLSRF
ncbi:MAG TPA: redoxin domain-containing protein [Rhodocyclaceae bacterium]|nr:redoxin domain-containing protein [Rhodocyclaceae bacterium]